MFSRLLSHVIDRGYAHCGPQYQYEAQPVHLASLISGAPEQRQKSHRRPLSDESNRTTIDGTSRITEPGLISLAATALSRAVACASRRTHAGSSSNDEGIRTNYCKTIAVVQQSLVIVKSTHSRNITRTFRKIIVPLIALGTQSQSLQETMSELGPQIKEF